MHSPCVVGVQHHMHCATPIRCLQTRSPPPPYSRRGAAECVRNFSTSEGYRRVAAGAAGQQALTLPRRYPSWAVFSASLAAAARPAVAAGFLRRSAVLHGPLADDTGVGLLAWAHGARENSALSWPLSGTVGDCFDVDVGQRRVRDGEAAAANRTAAAACVFADTQLMSGAVRREIVQLVFQLAPKSPGDFVERIRSSDLGADSPCRAAAAAPRGGGGDDGGFLPAGMPLPVEGGAGSLRFSSSYELLLHRGGGAAAGGATPEKEAAGFLENCLGLDRAVFRQKWRQRWRGKKKKKRQRRTAMR